MFFLSASLGGCIFSPNKSGKPKPSPPPVYPLLEYPERVLAALEIAYSSRDSVGYRKLFDYYYDGASLDPTGTTTRFRNQDEVDHIQALAEATTIVGVQFRLGAQTSWTRLTSDKPINHPNWAVIQISGSQFSVEVDDNVQGPLTVTGADEFFVFRFKPSTPEPSSRTDTLWTITQWEENGADTPP